MNASRIAVTSRSFSRHPVLRQELLARYPNTKFNDAGAQLMGADLIDFLQGRERAITALEYLSEDVFSQLPELQIVSKYGVGLEMIDLEAMRRRGIRLGWTGGVNRRSVSELVIAFAVVMLRHVPQANRELRAGTWRQHVGRQLSDQTVGIIGCGHIGKDLVGLLQAFGCSILACDILDFPEFYRDHGVIPLCLEDLLRRSDVVTLHVPLDPTTRGMLDAGMLDLMKPGAILINAARGGMVDETALKQRLLDGRLGAAAFDVFRNEPPEDSELLALPNFLATPHIGGSAEEAILAMGRSAIAGLDRARLPDPAAK